MLYGLLYIMDKYIVLISVNQGQGCIVCCIESRNSIVLLEGITGTVLYGMLYCRGIVVWFAVQQEQCSLCGLLYARDTVVWLPVSLETLQKMQCRNAWTWCLYRGWVKSFREAYFNLCILCLLHCQVLNLILSLSSPLRYLNSQTVKKEKANIFFFYTAVTLCRVETHGNKHKEHIDK